MRYNGNWDRGPRGPRYGRHHSPLGGGLLGLFGLLIGLRVILSLIGVAGVVIGAVFAGVGAAFRGVFAAVRSVFAGLFGGSMTAGGVAIGIAIGLVVYRMIRQKRENEEARARADETAEAPETPQESEYVEPTSSRNYYA